MNVGEPQQESEAPRVRPEDDAEAFVDLCKQLDAETRFMLLEPGERRTTADEQRALIAGIAGAANRAMFVAEVGQFYIAADTARIALG